ncbi:MAG: zinc-ribbon domain-containing protein [Blastocatellia bacterium]
MYCPRCGQQALDEVRFCSRCGLRLDAVTFLLDNDGSVAPPEAESGRGNATIRQKGIRLGVKLIFLSIVLFPLFFAIAISRDVDSPAPLLVPVTVFLVGLMRLLYSVIFEEEQSHAKHTRVHPQEIRPGRNKVLPPPDASVTARRPVNTADMLYPPSVTENTTNLLDNK